MTLSTEHRIHALLLLVIIALLLGRYVPMPGIDMRSLYERLGIEWTVQQQAPTDSSVLPGPEPRPEVYIGAPLLKRRDEG